MLRVVYVLALVCSVAGLTRHETRQWIIHEHDQATVAAANRGARRALSSSFPTGIEARIAYGVPLKANDPETQFVASLLKESSTGKLFHSCGGTLITKNLILTAAHCFFDSATKKLKTPKYALVGGTNISSPSSFKEIKAMSKFLYPPGFKIGTYATLGLDIGIAVLSTKSAQPAIKGLATRNPAVGTSITALGWGVTQTATVNWLLKSVSLKTSSTACPKLPAGMLCATGAKNGAGFASTCSGDSGGPQVLGNGVQTSVTSFGPAISCGKSTWGAYSSVADYYASFIAPAIAKYSSVGEVCAAAKRAYVTLAGRRLRDYVDVAKKDKVSSLAACAAQCVANPRCFTFSYKAPKECNMYQGSGSTAVMKSDSQYTAGFIYCKN